MPENETRILSVGLPVETYRRLRFESERLKYPTLSAFIRDVIEFQLKHFVSQMEPAL